jgi:hypothetical protein
MDAIGMVLKHLEGDRQTWLGIAQYAMRTRQINLARTANEEASSDARLINTLRRLYQYQ